MTITPAHLARTAAALAAASWTAKSIAIGTAGGLDKSPLEGPLFFLGMVFALVASAALGVALAGSRPAWLRMLAGLAGIVTTFATAMAVDALVGAVRGPSEGSSWVWAEVNLWVIALLVLAATWRVSTLRSGGGFREAQDRQRDRLGDVPGSTRGPAEEAAR